MRKIIAFIALGIMLTISGCSNNKTEETTAAAVTVEDGEYRLDIYSADDISKVLVSVEDGETVQKLIESPEWKEVAEKPEDLVPEYGIIVWQKKKVNYKQSSDAAPEYNTIEAITTFKDSNYIERVYSQNAVKGANIPISSTAFYYEVPDEFLTVLRELVSEAQGK